MNLIDYVLAHTERGECACGRCVDRGDSPDPSAHTIDTGFFKVAICNDPQAEELKRLVVEWPGDFAQVDPFDGMPHPFTQLGAWLGDQGIALQFMALAALLHVASLYRTEYGPVLIPNAMMEQLEGADGKDAGDATD